MKKKTINQIIKWLVLTLIGAYLASLIPNSSLYYLFNKDIKVAYLDKTEFKDGKEHVKIQVVNRWGKDLKDATALVTLDCSNIGYKYYSTEAYALSEGGGFLLNDDKELLFSPDALLINLTKSKEFNCSDALFEMVEYKKINSTHSKINQVWGFDFFIDDKEERIEHTVYTPGEIIMTRSCFYCDFIVSVHASNLKKPVVEEIKDLKFVSGIVPTNVFDEVIEIASYYRNNEDNPYHWTYRSLVPTGRFCRNMNSIGCMLSLCEKVDKKFDIVGLECDKELIEAGLSFPMGDPFTDKGLDDPVVNLVKGGCGLP